MNPQNQKLYVGNLNFDANEDQVRELFTSYGEVAEVKIIMDRFSGRSRGFAFVRMNTAEDAGKAKDALQGQPFQGKALVIDLARTEQRDRPQGDRPYSAPPQGDRRERSPMGGGGGAGGEFRPRREWGDRPAGDRRDSRGNNNDRFNR
jgi:RNA recognition motif-containing protein